MTDNPELDRWNERFAKNAYHFGTVPNHFLATQAALIDLVARKPVRAQQQERDR